jgi:hypothetical protein
MPFPPHRAFPVKLKSTTPSAFDAEALKTQLANVGLSCAQLTTEALNGYIANVNSQLPRGAVQSWGIKAPRTSPTFAAKYAHLKVDESEGIRTQAALTSKMEDAATANWEPDSTAQGYNTQLFVIAFPDHFNWLYDNRGSNQFTGVKVVPAAATGYYPNAQAIQNLFVQMCLAGSSTLVKGLDQSTMQAALSNIISPLNDASLSNYDVSDSRDVLLVDDYDPNTGYAAGVGVLYIGWHLKIQDYKRKTKDGGDTHDTYLQINCASVLYTDVAPLCRDYNAVVQQFGISNPSPCPIV